MKGEQLDQLGAEAEAVADALKATDATRGSEPRSEGDATAGGASSEARASGEGATAGAPDDAAEVIQNPAPKIKAALELVRDVPMLRAFVPEAFIAALNDAAIAELAEAFGELAVKYRINLAPAALDKWKEETRAALAVGSVAFNIWRAMHADDEDSRAARARDVSGGAGDAAPRAPWEEAERHQARPASKPVEPS